MKKLSVQKKSLLIFFSLIFLSTPILFIHYFKDGIFESKNMTQTLRKISVFTTFSELKEGRGSILSQDDYTQHLAYLILRKNITDVREHLNLGHLTPHDWAQAMILAITFERDEVAFMLLEYVPDSQHSLVVNLLAPAIEERELALSERESKNQRNWPELKKAIEVVLPIAHRPFVGNHGNHKSIKDS